MKRWKTIISKAGAKGANLLKKLRFVGILCAAWTLGTQGTHAAIAEALDITPAGVADLLEGKGKIALNSWDPAGSVVAAELRSGDVIKEGDNYWLCNVLPNKIVEWVREGTVDYIEPTSVPGVVDIFVEFGAERRKFTGISDLRNDLAPLEGEIYPYD